MSLSLVLSSLLVAQGGHCAVVHGPSLGLALDASSEGAEGLGGTRSTEAFTCEVPSAGGADHSISAATRVSAGTTPCRVFAVHRCGPAMTIRSSERTPRSKAAFAQAQWLETAPTVRCLVTPSRVTETVQSRASLALACFMAVLSREIPPVPPTGIGGRGERSLVCEDFGAGLGFFDLANHAGRAGLPAAPVLAEGVGQIAGIEYIVHALQIRGVQLHAFDEDLDGVDVFHVRTIAQALAQVNIESRTTNRHLRTVAA